jgi:alpha-1,2-mannosyltransferase
MRRLPLAGKTPADEDEAREPRPRRPVLYGIILWIFGAAALTAGCLGAKPSPGHGGGLIDLGVYRGSVISLRDGASLYAYHAPGLGESFIYPPLAGLVFFPLAYGSFHLATVLWTLVTACAVVGIALTVGRQLADSGPTRLLASGAVLSALAISLPVRTDLHFGQVSITLAALVIFDVLLLRERREAGVLIGVTAGIKLTSLIFIPYLWVVGRRRAAVTAIAVFLAGVAVAWIILPSDSSKFWLSKVFDGSNVFNFTNNGNISLEASLERLGLGGPLEKVLYLLLAIVVFVVALRRAAAAERLGSPLAALIVVGAASLLISPISWEHHQVWLVLAAFVPMRGPRPARNAWPPVALAIMILPLPFMRPLLAIATAMFVPFRYEAVGSEQASL